MKTEYTKREIQDAFEYGIGLMCGKHNISTTKKDRKANFKSCLDLVNHNLRIRKNN